VGTSFEQPILTGQVDGIGVLNLLECVKQVNPAIKVYQASTSELFGNKSFSLACTDYSLSEASLLWPASPYAAAKLYSFHMTRIYREAYDMFCVSGILFNHESPLRGLEFVTRKVTNAVARIKLGLQKHLELGFLDAKRDWGYAAEYVEAMWLMLQQDKAGDFTIATGNSYSVRELCDVAFSMVGLNYNDHVLVAEKYKRCMDVYSLCGDASQAQEKLGWSASTGFRELVELMVEADLKRWTDWQAGRLFPWDAINDPLCY
jgi:GDPmannose 4,6-dehydratase